MCLFPSTARKPRMTHSTLSWNFSLGQLRSFHCWHQRFKRKAKLNVCKLSQQAWRLCANQGLRWHNHKSHQEARGGGRGGSVQHRSSDARARLGKRQKEEELLLLLLRTLHRLGPFPMPGAKGQTASPCRGCWCYSSGLLLRPFSRFPALRGTVGWGGAQCPFRVFALHPNICIRELKTLLY